ncbi:Crp/Fnr family transcriptional regulator [Planotetraspora silvatica]|uniref:Crp/Fnr family transcriptional regulator n=1 Tax=Planotetraspora silvatica TaxID=234614 RepID=A0A8J3XMR9_9ACTN|nr:Crp/Fnr family transcriptional regulator [Planotetraspora silvatica]GII46789.1 Crp/Fnr family transcriptional regulator [Planotetraspora silvatica]
MATPTPRHPHGPRRLGPWPPATLLGSLEPRIRETLLSLGTFSQFVSGETLIMEGDPRTKDVFLIVQGYMKVVSNSADGKVVLLAIRSDGDLVGELASLDGSPRVASVVTVGPCFVRKISQRDFLGFLADHPDVALAVNANVVGKLRHATWHRIEFGTSPMPVRVARVLIYLAQRYGETTAEGVLIGSLTQPELAAMIGAREHSVHKILRSMRERQVIATRYGRILILDSAALYADAGISEIPPEYGVWPSSGPQSEED